MTRRRWIADEWDKRKAALAGSNATHLARVLRARPGQEFELSVGGIVRLATVTAVSDERVEFSLGDEVMVHDVLPIALLLAVIKFDRLELAIEKCTELGVARIMPVLARRTEVHLCAAAEKRVERWRRIAHEAAQQSRRASVPEILAPAKLADALAAAPGGVQVLLNETETGHTLRQVLGATPEPESLQLAIGPEGGWTEQEISLFESRGWRSASLGPTILRAETAAIAATAIAAAMLFRTES